MSQIMEPDPVEPGPGSNGPPGLLEIDQVGPGLCSADHVRIARKPWQAPQHIAGHGAEMNRLLASLAVREVEPGTIQIDPLPFQGQDFGQSSTCEEQQANGRQGPGRHLPLLTQLIQRFAKLGDFFGTQKALALLLRILLDVPARI